MEFWVVVEMNVFIYMLLFDVCMKVYIVVFKYKFKLLDRD